MLKSKKNLIKFFVLLILISTAILSVYYFNLSQYLSPTKLRGHMSTMGVIAPLIFILIYTIATIFFLPGTPLTIASGIIFGKFLGTLYTVVGATIGATIAFLIARFLGKDFIESFLKGKYEKLYEYDKKLEEKGLLVVLFLRFIPLFPFNGLNFALGLTKVRIKHFVIGTLIGIIPGSFVLAFFGESVAEFNIISILIAVVLFLLLMFTPTIYKRISKKKNKDERKI